MSGSVEFKINGQLVGHIYFHNEGYVNDRSCLYAYEYFSWPNGKTKSGKLRHVRDEGLEKLVKLILQKVED